MFHIEARDQAGEISFLDNMDISPTLNIFDTGKKEEMSPRIRGVGSAVKEKSDTKFFGCLPSGIK